MFLYLLKGDFLDSQMKVLELWLKSFGAHASHHLLTVMWLFFVLLLFHFFLGGLMTR